MILFLIKILLFLGISALIIVILKPDDEEGNNDNDQEQEKIIQRVFELENQKKLTQKEKEELEILKWEVKKMSF